MKKTFTAVISVVLAVCLVFALSACGKPAAAEYKLGMGIVVSTDSSDTAKAQVDSTAAAVVMGADGKIVSCRLDVAQCKMDVTDGAVDTAATFRTKMELGEEYGMVAHGGAIAEWDAQAKAFEEYVVGKTAEEVKNIETTVNEKGHEVAVDEALLSSCTMTITEFKEAVVKACNDPRTAAFTTAGEFKLGLAALTDASGSKAAAEEEDGVVKMYTEFGAAVVDPEGKILAAAHDMIQPNIAINTAGEIVSAEFKGTKMELGDDYGMVAHGGAIAEWFAQAKAFTDYVVGKTADEVRAIETKTTEEGHVVAADEALLAQCTMTVTGMINSVAQAADYAR